MRRLFRGVTLVVGLGLFVRSVQILGVGQIHAALIRVGWGLGTILLLSGAREAARAFAWTQAIEGPARLRFAHAFRARLAGEALSALLPMGILVGEPTKAADVERHVPLATAVRAQIVEFAFYSGSLIPLLAGGAIALSLSMKMPIAIDRLPVAALVVSSVATIALVIGGSQRVRRSLLRLAGVVTGFAARHPVRVWSIAALQGVFQGLGIAEVYVTLKYVSAVKATFVSAVVLETVSRAITMVFKVLPMRVGVDEAGAALAAGSLHLGVATGLTLALVRKVRLLAWSAVGLVLLARGSSNRSPRPVVSSEGSANGTLALARLWNASRVILAAAGVVLISGSVVAAGTPTGSVAGSIVVVGADGQPLVMPGVTVSLTCGAQPPRTEVTDERGEFRFSDVPVAACSLVADLQGFKSARASIDVEPDATTTAKLQLSVEAIRDEVTVKADGRNIQEETVTTRVERVDAREMQTAPIANERFQDALPLIPGVVRGPDGLLNISGTRSNQSAVMFNSANGADPVTGEDAIELPIDAVRFVQVRMTAYPAEFGQSVGAVTTVETEQGGATWRLQVNDLEPRPRRRGGKFVGIESFTPRMTVGGPLVKDRLSVLESVQYEFTRTRTFGLPPFASDTQVEGVETFSRLDWTVGPTNHFTASATVSPRKTSHAGLNTFNPQGVTPDIENHGTLGSATDQIIVGGRGLFDTRISVKEFDAAIYPSQGRAPMVLAPDVNSGSYFNDQDRTSRRVEWQSTYTFTPWGPAHLLKAGTGLTYETFDGVSISHPVDIVREAGTRIEESLFVGDGKLRRSRSAVMGYAQDSWTVNSRLTAQYGGRFDYDSVTGDVNVAPRLSFTALVSPDGKTVARGGVGIFYDPLPLNVASFDQMQNRVVTRFDLDGITTIGTPLLVPNIVSGALHTPRSVNWNVEIDREWITNLFVRVGYQERENRFEPVLDPIAVSDGDGRHALELRTQGESRYRHGQITARFQFHGDDQIVGSYTRSSATGHLNDFNSYFGNIENPVIRPDERGPLPWDAPDRYLFWGSVSFPYGFTVFPVLDVRSGFPLSVVDDARNFVGPRNQAGRYPTFVSLDTQVSKRLRVFGHHATIGLKVFNITNHFNPRDYQGNLASASFGGFANSVGRAFRGKWVFEL